MEALEHLVDDDAEALVDRLLLRDAEDAGELVLEGTGPVELDVGGGEREALAAAGQEGLERGLVARRDQLPPAPAALALGLLQVVVEGGGFERDALLLGGALREESR